MGRHMPPLKSASFRVGSGPKLMHGSLLAPDSTVQQHLHRFIRFDTARARDGNNKAQRPFTL